MTREEYCAKIEEATKEIAFEGELIDYKIYGSGHINDTYLVRYKQEDGSVKKYILQRMNHEIFTKPWEVMENILGVTSFLKEKISKNGGDISRETMNVIKTKNGESYYKDSIGSYWRGYDFIEGAKTYDMVETPDDFYQSAVAFGHFQSLLSDYNAESLHETIKDFHNTPDRYQKFIKAVEEDVCDRAKLVQEEIKFIMDREKDTHILMDLLKNKEIPLRVTHNDTKLNNIMIDDETHKAICVIDLDTVMPGFSVNDFGDSIRFGANTGAEDETDLSKISLDLNLFELYTKGFLEGCNGSLTEKELQMLPVGAKMMTLECGMRFLTDYLQGDTYFRVHRENHNLDRTRTQLKLVKDMEDKWDSMYEIVKKYQ